MDLRMPPHSAYPSKLGIITKGYTLIKFLYSLLKVIILWKMNIELF
jgi:hypothetical protein